MFRTLLLTASICIFGSAAQAQAVDQFGRTITVASDGVTFSVTNPDGSIRGFTAPGPASALAAFNRMPPPGWAPPQPVPTFISVPAFLARITVPELTAINAYSALFLPLVNSLAGRNGMMSVASPLLSNAGKTGILDTAVAANALTAGREAQILNLEVTSP